jgi:N4-gp56 family major capsid protein
MANSPNTSVSTFGAPLLHPAWDKALHWALRSKPLFRRFSDVKPMQPTNNSKVVYLPLHEYETVAADRHVVDEVVAADQVQATENTYVRMLLTEHGHAMGRTTFLDDTSYIPVDPILARKMAAHMADTLDAMAADQLYDGDRVEISGSGGSESTTSFTQIASSGGGDFEFAAEADNTLATANSDFMSARIARRAVARLRSASADTFPGESYVGIISPETSVDYQEDAGAVGWSEPHINVDTAALYTGRVGKHAGVVWIEHPRARFLDDEGASSADVQQTLIFGREVLGEFVKREPGPGVSPVLDTYNRHRTIYWYGTLGFAIFRQEPLWRIHHVASTESS